MFEIDNEVNNMENNETKREKFVRLAEARTNKIIDMIQLLSNCSNTNVYEYSQKDIDQIFNAIDQELKDAKKKFSQKDCTKNARFILK